MVPNKNSRPKTEKSWEEIVSSRLHWISRGNLANCSPVLPCQVRSTVETVILWRIHQHKVLPKPQHSCSWRDEVGTREHEEHSDQQSMTVQLFYLWDFSFWALVFMHPLTSKGLQRFLLEELHLWEVIVFLQKRGYNITPFHSNHWKHQNGTVNIKAQIKPATKKTINMWFL